MKIKYKNQLLNISERDTPDVSRIFCPRTPLSIVTTRASRRPGGLAGWLLCWALAGEAALADAGQLETLKRMSIDDLANLDVSIVSGRPERLGDTPAAVFVVTAEDIRRSGATTLPEVLRMVPGIEVARANTVDWAVSIRGFNGQFANKLLVLVDGRSVYSPLFSGVLWEAQNIVLQDVERIEVIRGPGASTWGANAVNGVINIITKRAEDTQGGYVGGVVGSRQQEAVARFGGRLGEDGYYRVYAQVHQQDPLPAIPGSRSPETDWRGERAGFRADWRSGATDLMLRGELYREDSDQGQLNGGYLQGRWENRRSGGFQDTLQAYIERSDLGDWSEGEMRGENTLDIVEVEYRRQFPALGGHTIITGLSYRWISSDWEVDPPAAIGEPRRHDQVISAFAQDDIRLISDSAYLTLGLKLEHNDFTGLEVQPSARLRWLPAAGQTFWVSVSRAMRTPSLAENSLTVIVPAASPSPATGGLPVVLQASGSPDFDSETLIAYELGYRWQVSPRLGLDAAFFYNDYDRLRTIDLAPGPPQFEPFPTPRLTVRGTAGNNLGGEAHGFELAADYRPSDRWRFQAAYSYLDLDLRPEANSTDPLAKSAEGESPAHQFSLRSSMDLSDKLEFDLWLRYVSELPGFNISSYLTLDARLGWKASKNLAISLVGRNLINSPHQEFGTSLFATGKYEVEREAYLMAEWRF